MSEIDDLRQAIRALESQRAVLGDAALELVLAPLEARVRELVQGADAISGGERKHVTVLFADVSGFTAMSESGDPEDVRNFMNRCFDLMGEVIRRYGGHIDKFIGDEVMVLFGAPVSMEDHAARALHTAIDIRDAISRFNEDEASRRGLTIGVHIGVNTGLVIAGAMGTAGRQEYTVIGDAVNIAARLVARATVGEVLVGQDTCKLVDEGFEFETVGAIELEGRTASTDVHRLLSARMDAQSVRGRGPAQTPMLGRSWELSLLEDVLNETEARRCVRSVTIEGPAGIGKSRLVEEFRRAVEASRPDVTLLRGSALPHMQTTPYFVVADLLRNLLQVRESDTISSIRERLDATMSQLGMEEVDAGNAIAELMAIEVRGDDPQAVPPEARRERIFRAATDMLNRAARNGTVLIVFEDLHWADDLSLQLADHAARTVSDGPVLFVNVTRPADPGSTAPAHARAGDATRIVLTDLDDATSRAYVHSLLPEIERLPAIVDGIVAKGQGNPFFLQSVLGTLMDQGVLQADGAGLRASRPLMTVELPDNVRAVLAERIDRLPAAEKTVVQNAAIVGRVFWQGLVEALTGSSAGPQLASLAHRAFIERHGVASFGADWEWEFRHVLLQEVAYSSILRETRKTGHLAAASWLLEHVGDRRHEYATLLAYHFRMGEEWARASDFAESAGDRAAALYANAEARQLYSEAIDALKTQPADPARDQRLIDVTLKLADVSYFTPSDDVRAALDEAGALAASLQDATRALRVSMATASWLYQAGNGRPAVETALRCIADANAAGMQEMLVVPYQIVGRAMFALGEYAKCIEMIERSNELAGATRDGAIDHASFGFLGMAYTNIGDIPRGSELGYQGLAIAERLGNRRRAASAHLYIGVTPCAAGNLVEAGPHLEEAVRLARETSDQSVIWVALGLLGYWHAQKGEIDHAVACLDEALATASELNSYLTVPLLEAYRAEVDILSGSLDAAAARAEKAATLGRDTRQQTFEAEALRVLAWAAYYRGDPGAAETHFRASIDVHNKTGSRVMECRTLFQFGRFMRACGRRDEADEIDAQADAIRQQHDLDWLPGPVPAPPDAVLSAHS